MTRMHRINIVIDAELDERLEREAVVRGMSKSALVRECVERGLPEPTFDNGLLALAELSKLTVDIESADIDTELYGPFEVDS